MYHKLPVRTYQAFHTREALDHTRGRMLAINWYSRSETDFPTWRTAQSRTPRHLQDLKVVIDLVWIVISNPSLPELSDLPSLVPVRDERSGYIEEGGA